MSIISYEKVLFERYALRAIPPTSWAPPVHKSRATSRSRKHISRSSFLYIKVKKHKLSVKFDDEGGDGRNDGVVRESYDFGGDDVISVAESLSDFRIIRPRKFLPLI